MAEAEEMFREVLRERHPDDLALLVPLVKPIESMTLAQRKAWAINTLHKLQTA
jgi:hypothetical protein